jgi:hypothetical protein
MSMDICTIMQAVIGFMPLLVGLAVRKRKDYGGVVWSLTNS